MPLRVLLLHGLARTPLSMRPLARALRRAGHGPETFGYFPLREPYDAIVARLSRRLDAWDAAGRPYAAVGHSLGGLLVRSACAGPPRPGLVHVVMLGTPNRPPRLARLAVRVPPFRWYTRDTGARLADPAFFAALPAPAAPYTIVAGTAGPRRAFGGDVNDGIVALDETRVTDADAVIEVAALHTTLPLDRRVRRVVLDVLSRAAW